MENEPYFSVIVPVYNSAKYLEECIESVIRQTYPSWELILVDDGSTDESGCICDSYCEIQGITVIHQSNKGQIAARSTGFDRAQGKYVIGLDSDDYLAEECLERIKKAIDDTGSDMVMYSLILTGEKQGVCVQKLLPGREYSVKELLCDVIINANHSMCNKAIKAELVKDSNCDGLDRSVRFDEDCAQLISIICKARSGYVMDDSIYYYRVHNESVSQTTKLSHVTDTGRVTEFVIEQLKKNDLYDNEMESLIYIAYLRTISLRLMKMFIGNRLSKDELNGIHYGKAYIGSRQYESYHHFTNSQFIILKLFRGKRYNMIRAIAKLYDFMK